MTNFSLLTLCKRVRKNFQLQEKRFFILNNNLNLVFLNNFCNGIDYNDDYMKKL